MVIPHLSMHSVPIHSKEGLETDQALFVYPEVSYSLQELQQHLHPQCSIIMATLIDILYFKRKKKWLICGCKITCLIPNLKFNIVVLETVQDDYEAIDVWLNTVILEMLCTLCGHLTATHEPTAQAYPGCYLQKAPKPSSIQCLISSLPKLSHFLFIYFL